MTDEEKKKMADLETKVTTLTTENTALKDSNVKLGEDIKGRDTRIVDLEKAAKTQGENFKKLRDMSEAEKELLSEETKGLMARLEAREEQDEKDKAERAERDVKERNERLDTIALKIAKGDKGIADQIKVTLATKLNPEIVSKAITESELTPLLQDSFNMLGISTPNPDVRDANNFGGYNAPIENNDSFANTEAGKSLGQAMGLSFTSPEANKQE